MTPSPIFNKIIMCMCSCIDIDSWTQFWVIYFLTPTYYYYICTFTPMLSSTANDLRYNYAYTFNTKSQPPPTHTLHDIAANNIKLNILFRKSLCKHISLAFRRSILWCILFSSFIKAPWVFYLILSLYKYIFNARLNKRWILFARSNCFIYSEK